MNLQQLKKIKSDSASVVVEFALVVPLLLTLVFGITDFGRLFYANLSITSASREGARYSSLMSGGASIADISTIVYASAPNACRVAQLSACAHVTVAPSPTLKVCDRNISNENTEVTVTTPFVWTLPVGKLFGGSSTNRSTLSAKGVMLCVG
ncbi:MAG: TadE/TadG family type IV pilus assembly protein [Candidatus Nanopelagicaceae bacterium]